MLKKSNNLTNSEKLSLLDQLLNIPNRDMLKYAKVSIRDFLKKESNPNMINDSYATYKHTCVQAYSDHFKCKFGAYLVKLQR